VIGKTEFKKRETAGGQKPQLASNLCGITAATNTKTAQGAANVILKHRESNREGGPPSNAFNCLALR